MDSPAAPPATPAHDPGLPPVQPPSATMLFRLFLVPFLIVAVLVGLYLVGQTLYGKLWRTRSPEKVLRDLDSANPDIRWRAAADLSQELPRSPELRSDAWFALELADRLDAALKEGAAAEQEFASGADALTPAAREAKLNKELAPRRNLVMYLGACLGNFTVPVGVPLLTRMATQTSGMEPEALAESRRRALFALAALGDNLRRYDALPDEEKDAIAEQLEAGPAACAGPARRYLEARRRGKADSFGVAAALEACAGDEDPSLRMLAAYAATFWHGDGAEEARVEKFLAALTRDPGTGEEARDQRLRRNPDSRLSRPVTTRPGYEVQVNANIALARRGSPLVRLDLFEETLDPERLRSIFRLRPREGAEEPNEALVVVTLTGSLRAVAELATRRPELRPRIDALVPRVEALADDRNSAVNAEAARALSVLRGKS